MNIWILLITNYKGKKYLAPYENFVRARLELCEDASAAQVHDWLKYDIVAKA